MAFLFLRYYTNCTISSVLSQGKAQFKSRPQCPCHDAQQVRALTAKPETEPLDPHNGRQEPTPAYSSDLYMCTTGTGHTHTHNPFLLLSWWPRVSRHSHEKLTHMGTERRCHYACPLPWPPTDLFSSSWLWPRSARLPPLTTEGSLCPNSASPLVCCPHRNTVKGLKEGIQLAEGSGKTFWWRFYLGQDSSTMFQPVPDQSTGY